MPPLERCRAAVPDHRPQHPNVTVSLTSLTDSSAAFVLAACSLGRAMTPPPTPACPAPYTGTWTAGQNTNTAAATGHYTDAYGNTTSPSDPDDANYITARPSRSTSPCEVSADGGSDLVRSPTRLPGPTPSERCRAAVPDHRPQHLERHAGQPDLADRQLGRLRAGRLQPRSRRRRLAPDASFVRTYTGTWTAGQNTNTAAATVSYTDV